MYKKAIKTKKWSILRNLALVRLKLPRDVTIELSVKGELSDATTIDGLFAAIEQSCRSREIADMASGWGSNKSADKQNFRQKERVHMVSKKNPQKEKKNDASSQECVLCKSKSHPTKSCTNPTVPPKDRFKAVMNGNLCSYCLRVGHKKWIVSPLKSSNTLVTSAVRKTTTPLCTWKLARNLLRRERQCEP